MAYKYKCTVTFPYDKYDEVFKLLEKETNPVDTRIDVAYDIEPNGDAKLDLWSRVDVTEIVHKCKEQFPAYKDDKERGKIVETFENHRYMEGWVSHPLFESFFSTKKHARK